MVWHAQSCCGRLGGSVKGDVTPTQPPKSPATTALEHFEVCHGRVFARSKSVMEVSRPKSCREPFRDEMRGTWRQTWAQRVRGGLLALYGRPQLMRGAYPMYERHLRCSSSAFMHSNQQRCEIDRTIFVMVDPNFQATNVRWSGTPRAAKVSLKVPPGTR